MYKSIIDAIQDMETKGYVLYDKFKNVAEMERFMNYYNNLEERCKDSSEAVAKFKEKA